jgi:hypothetical protein
LIPVQEGMSQLCTLDLRGFCFISSVRNNYISCAWYSYCTLSLLFDTDISNRQMFLLYFLVQAFTCSYGCDKMVLVSLHTQWNTLPQVPLNPAYFFDVQANVDISIESLVLSQLMYLRFDACACCSNTNLNIIPTSSHGSVVRTIVPYLWHNGVNSFVRLKRAAKSNITNNWYG